MTSPAPKKSPKRSPEFQKAVQLYGQLSEGMERYAHWPAFNFRLEGKTFFGNSEAGKVVLFKDKVTWWPTNEDSYWLSVPWYQWQALFGSKHQAVTEALATPHLEDLAASLGMRYNSVEFSRYNLASVAYRLSHPGRLYGITEHNVTVAAKWSGARTTPNRVSGLALELEIGLTELADELLHVSHFFDTARQGVSAASSSFSASPHVVANYIREGYIPLLKKGFAADLSKERLSSSGE